MVIVLSKKEQFGNVPSNKMISVIIPVYNRSATISRAVRSVLDQTIKDLEVIVVDDCSDEDLLSVIKTIDDPRVIYFRLEKRSGACVARNKGIEIARGNYIAFQDSDDEWVNNKLEQQINALNETNADICSCLVKRFYPENPHKAMIWPPEFGDISKILDHVTLRRKSYISTQTILAKREVFDEFLFDPLVKKSQDYDFIIRASQKYCVYFLAKELVIQYLQKDSISLGGYNRFVESRMYFLSKYKDICEEDAQFKYHLLQQLAHYKTLDGQNSRKEYMEMYRIKHRIHDLLCSLLFNGFLKNTFGNALIYIQKRIKKV